MSEPITLATAAVRPLTALPVTSIALERRKAKHHSLWEQYKRLLISGRFEAWSALWCHDGRFQVLHSGAEATTAVEGRDAVVNAFTEVCTRCERIRIKDVTLHQTIDPDIFIVSYLIEVGYADAQRYVNSIVARVRTRDGRIAEIIESVDGPAHAAFLQRLETAA
jgi:ketosteroid isomerase-like protein